MHHQHFSFWCWFIQFSVIFLIKRKWWRSYLIWCGNFKLSWHFYFRLKPQMKCKTRDCLHSQPCLDHVVTTARHLPNQSSVFNENLTWHFMFQHCQPMRKINSKRSVRAIVFNPTCVSKYNLSMVLMCKAISLYPFQIKTQLPEFSKFMVVSVFL